MSQISQRVGEVRWRSPQRAEPQGEQPFCHTVGSDAAAALSSAGGDGERKKRAEQEQGKENGGGFFHRKGTLSAKS